MKSEAKEIGKGLMVLVTVVGVISLVVALVYAGTLVFTQDLQQAQDAAAATGLVIVFLPFIVAASHVA